MTPARAPRAPFALLVTGLIAGGMALLLGLNTMSAANELHRHDIAGDHIARKFAKTGHGFLLRCRRYHALRFDSRRAMTMNAARLAAVATANSP